MKRVLIIAALPLLLAAFGGCSDDDNNSVANESIPLASPQGVYTVTGDNEVTVHWNGIYDPSVEEYVIWRSLQATTNYSEIGRETSVNNPNLDLILYSYVDHGVINGTTYYYAVSSVDTYGNESELSAEDAYDTPRPQGEITVYPANSDPAHSGFDFSAHHTVYDTSALADVFVDIYDNVYYLNVANAETDIMDMGYTSSFDEISYSPSTSVSDGWSKLGYVELLIGHTYVVWTSDNHFAKVRVVEINVSSGFVRFEWAWQVAIGNPELVAPPPGTMRPEHDPGFMNKQQSAIDARSNPQ
jgi:hypothetical protein